MADTVRWSLVISVETDRAVRTYLAHRGMRKGDLSMFVEDAEVVPNPPLVEVSPDPGDNFLLALAVAAQAITRAFCRWGSLGVSRS